MASRGKVLKRLDYTNVYTNVVAPSSRTTRRTAVSESSAQPSRTFVRNKKPTSRLGQDFVVTGVVAHTMTAPPSNIPVFATASSDTTVLTASPIRNHARMALWTAGTTKKPRHPTQASHSSGKGRNRGNGSSRAKAGKDDKHVNDKNVKCDDNNEDDDEENSDEVGSATDVVGGILITSSASCPKKKTGNIEEGSTEEGNIEEGNNDGR